jgi:hypothetical protein
MTAHTVTGLTNDTEYMFRVAAVNHTRGDYSERGGDAEWWTSG